MAAMMDTPVINTMRDKYDALSPFLTLELGELTSGIFARGLP